MPSGSRSPSVDPAEAGSADGPSSGGDAESAAEPDTTPEPATDSERLEAAYQELSHELWVRFYLFCSDPERASDAVQEVFTRLALHWGLHRQASDNDHEQNSTDAPEAIRDVKAWLIRVGQNWLRDGARRKASKNKHLDTLDRLPAESAGPLAGLVQEERHALVRASLDRLSEDDRAVLLMRYSLSWPSRRIAATLNISPAAVDMRLSRARSRLADFLTEAGLTDDSL